MSSKDQSPFFLIFNRCVLDRSGRCPFQLLSTRSLYGVEREYKIQSWFQTVVCEKRADKTAHQDHDVSFEDFLLSLVVVLGLKFSLIQQLIVREQVLWKTVEYRLTKEV